LDEHSDTTLLANIQQIYRVDLEGDGIDEVIINAGSYNETFFYSGQEGNYSYIILRQLIDGEVKNTVLSAHEYQKADQLIYVYYIQNILDLNGDGIMEIIIEGRYYEGDWYNIYDMQDGEPVNVLTYGVGA